MSNYVHSSRRPYGDYLQTKDFDAIIAEQTRSIIASNEELQERHISVSENLSTEMSRGFERLSFDLQKISDGISELNATFIWGFSEMLTMVGSMRDSIEELVKIAKTPAQTWAYEQFEIARDAFRRGHYSDSLKHLDNAIDGYAGNTGYRLEYRFHFLLGVIRLGSFKNNASDIVDLARAKRAFIDAAEYAGYDQPREAGRALLSAGWAAYCEGMMTEAVQYTSRAVALNPQLAEAHFQLAKIQMHVDNPEDALPPLRRAIELDPEYSIKAAAEDDFKRENGDLKREVDGLLQTLLQEQRAAAEGALVAAQERLNGMVGSLTDMGEYTGKDVLVVTAYSEGAKNSFDEAQVAAERGTYFGYRQASVSCGASGLMVEDVCKRAYAEVERRIGECERSLSDSMGFLVWLAIWGFLAGIGVIISIVLAVVNFSLEYASRGSFYSLLLAGVCALVLRHRAISSDREKLRRLQGIGAALIGLRDSANGDVP